MSKPNSIKCPACRNNVAASQTKVGDTSLLCAKHHEELSDYLSDITTRPTTNPTNISEVLNRIEDNADAYLRGEQSHKDYEKRKTSLVAQLKRIIEELLPEKKVDPNNLAGDPGKWESTIAGYNQALDDVRQQLESLTKEGE